MNKTRASSNKCRFRKIKPADYAHWRAPSKGAIYWDRSALYFLPQNEGGYIGSEAENELSGEGNIEICTAPVDIEASIPKDLLNSATKGLGFASKRGRRHTSGKGQRRI